jgi:hypothetical protein
MIDESGNITENIKTFEYSYRDMLRRHHCYPGPGTFFRKSVVDKLGGRDPQFRYVGDFDFWLRAGLLGPFTRVPETLATFRVHPDSASVSQMNTLMGEEHIRLVDKILSLPEMPADLDSIRREARSSAYYIAGVVCGAKATAQKLRYFSAALYHAPFMYIGEYRERLYAMLQHILVSVLN